MCTNEFEFPIELLKNNVAKWNRWRLQNSLVIVNLQEVDLSRADLRRSNLTDANLSGTDLTNADLRWANLKDAKISETTQIDDKWRELF
jgi:uncharacterized protein YjbI with pentapeptide repeats